MASNWLLNVLAILMLVVAVVSAIRLAAASWPVTWLPEAPPVGASSSQRTWGGVGIDVTNLLMGVAMAGMLSHSVITLSPLAWEWTFGLLTAWYARRLIGIARVNGLRSMVSGLGVVHFVHCAATLYMFSAMTTSFDIELARAVCGGAVPSITHSVLAWAIVVVLAGYCAWDIVGQLSRRRNTPARAPSASPSPLVTTLPAAACRVTMGLTMVLMLIVT